MNKIQTLIVNGLRVSATFDDENIKTIFMPLLHEWTRLQHQVDRRLFVFVAAPPGCGKSTLAVFLEQLSKNSADITELQAIGLDGFHFKQDYLKSHYVDESSVLMEEVKGNPETFDVSKLIAVLQLARDFDIMWPTYSRIKHDVEDNSVLINKKIVLVEGNYLLLNEEPWNRIIKFCDYSVFIYAEVDTLKARLIERKIRGGLSQKAAQSFYDKTDGPNVERVLSNHIKANTTLRLDNNLYYLE